DAVRQHVKCSDGAEEQHCVFGDQIRPPTEGDFLDAGRRCSGHFCHATNSWVLADTSSMPQLVSSPRELASDTYPTFGSSEPSRPSPDCTGCPHRQAQGRVQVRITFRRAVAVIAAAASMTSVGLAAPVAA